MKDRPKASRARSWLLLSALLGGTGCGVSPLLNHADAPSPGVAQESAQSDDDCPLPFPRLSLCAEITWKVPPGSEAGAELALKFTTHTPGSAPTPSESLPGEPHLYLWMPEHGHGSSPVTVERVRPAGETSEHHYIARDLFFIMPGLWEIHIELKRDGQVLEKVISRYVAP